MSDHGHSHTPPSRGIRCFCSACGMPFDLVFDEAQPGQAEVGIGACESGGIYDAYVDCPLCRHRHELK